VLERYRVYIDQRGRKGGRATAVMLLLFGAGGEIREERVAAGCRWFRSNGGTVKRGNFKDESVDIGEERREREGERGGERVGRW
jgi:hypothetical protein